jgi:hypothetical protein
MAKKNDKEKYEEPEVGTCTVSSFFQNSIEARIPEYQRGYVWDETKIEQLIIDLEEHFFEDDNFNENSPSYYFGTVLVHYTGNEYNIIDGQQRITTLLLMNHAWLVENSILSKEKWNLEYNSLISQKNVKANYELLKKASTKVKRYLSQIFSNLIFTVIITKSEDEAFIFFDSQNNRGIPLSPVDFLKSYHLRELKGKENLQEIFARSWDSNNRNKFLNKLFNLILWRNRNWKGKEIDFENRDTILQSFQKNTLKKSDDERVTLYPNAFNSLSSHLSFNEEYGVTIQPNQLHLQTRAEDYPFAIRQPIQKGIGFFLFTEKYYSIYNILFKEKRFPELANSYDKLYNNVSKYLRDFFELCVVSYYDKFKNKKLLHFVLWLDYLLGSYRLKQSSIVSRTIVKILRDKGQNLLDVIEMSYRPETVFDFLQKEVENISDEEMGKTYKGVRLVYKNNNLNYYADERGNDDDLKNKKHWINAKLIKK